MGRLATSWEAAKASWRVLRQDKELLLFPVLAGLASLAILLTFVGPAYLTGLIDRAFVQEDENARNVAYFLFFGAYLATSFATIYFNAALVWAANERLAGGDPTVGSGLRGANRHLGRIFAWSLFAATVNLILRALEGAARQRNNPIGAILAQLGAIAWTLATFFVIPVLLFEEKGVFGSFGRSTQLFKERWGESVAGIVGVGLVFGLLQFGLVLVGGFLAYTLGAALGLAGLVGILALTVLGVLVLAIFQQALGAVYRVALYRYSRFGQMAQQFPGWIVERTVVTA